MDSELHKLTQDTLCYLKSRIPKKKTPQPIVSKTAEKKQVTRPQKKVVTAPRFVQKKPAPPAHFTPLDTIKHLSHIDLLEKTHLPPKVAILVEQEEDRPFYQRLCTAIKERFCPCDLITDCELPWDTYLLVLAKKNLSIPHQIQLATIAVYEDNHRKKELWSSICQTLLQKLS